MKTKKNGKLRWTRHETALVTARSLDIINKRQTELKWHEVVQHAQLVLPAKRRRASNHRCPDIRRHVASSPGVKMRRGPRGAWMCRWALGDPPVKPQTASDVGPPAKGTVQSAGQGVPNEPPKAEPPARAIKSVCGWRDGLVVLCADNSLWHYNSGMWWRMPDPGSTVLCVHNDERNLMLQCVNGLCQWADSSWQILPPIPVC